MPELIGRNRVELMVKINAYCKRFNILFFAKIAEKCILQGSSYLLLLEMF